MPKSNSPAVRPGTGSSSIAIDQQSLERQKAHVQAGVNGHAHPTAQRPTSRPGSSSQPAAAAVKPENANKSPALNAARVAPPLANPSRLSNGVHVNGTVMPTTNGVALAVNGHPSVMPPPGAAYPSAAQHTPHPGMNSKYRQKGQGKNIVISLCSPVFLSLTTLQQNCFRMSTFGHTPISDPRILSM